MTEDTFEEQQQLFARLGSPITVVLITLFNAARHLLLHVQAHQPKPAVFVPKFKAQHCLQVYAQVILLYSRCPRMSHLPHATRLRYGGF
jgi:hypothetical protein